MPVLFGYVLQGGHIDVGFLGAAQIDKWGNLNSSVIGPWEKPKVRLPGSGGAVEVAANSKEVFVVMRRHDARTFVEQLDFCTSPGPVRALAEGGKVRGAGVTKVITELGILTRSSIRDELKLSAVHEGISVDQVRQNTGWDLKVSDDLRVTPQPTAEELRLLRTEIDPRRVSCANGHRENIPDMKIERIEAIPYEIPYLRPLKFASGEVTAADHVLLRIHTDTGIIGQADIPPPSLRLRGDAGLHRPSSTESSPPRTDRIGSVPPSGGPADTSRTVHNNTAKGGIDIALWDIIGQATGNSVWGLLGGFAPSMRVSHMLGFKEPEVLLEEAQRFGTEYGITTFRLKVGRRPISLDIEACRVLREGLGDDVEIYLDANRGWTANEALEVLRRTEGLGLSFLEEPCDAKEAMGRRRLVGIHDSIVSDGAYPPPGMSPASAFRGVQCHLYQDRPQRIRRGPGNPRVDHRPGGGHLHGQPDRHTDWHRGHGRVRSRP